MPDNALLVVDMQNDLCHDARRAEKVMAMLPMLKSAISLFVKTGQLVLYTCFSLSEDDEQFERFGDRYCISGSEGAKIIPELYPLKGPVIGKKKHSAFFETELNWLLQSNRVNNLFLAGLQTHICILTTAADANFRGYRTIAINECVLSSQDEKNRNALDWIGSYVGEVKTLEDTKTLLNNRSFHPLSDAYSNSKKNFNLSESHTFTTSTDDCNTPITMADGAGSGATLRLIRNEILSRFGNQALNPLEDSSWVSLGAGHIIVTADSHVVDPPLFPGGNIGSLSVAGTANDLIASGARPLYMTLGLVIGEGFPMEALKIILDSVAKTAAIADMQVVAGDTKVVEEKSGSIFLHTSGLGLPLCRQRDYAVSKAEAGDQIIVTGTIGDHGFAILSHREGLGFEHRIESDCIPLNGLLLPILDEFDGIRSLRDPTRGGLIGTLLDIAESSGVDLLVNHENIPITNEVAYGCEMLGIDPLQLVNEGKMVLIVSASQSIDLLTRLRSHPLGFKSEIIGEAKPCGGNSGRLLFRQKESIKVVVRPEGIPIPRLC